MATFSLELSDGIMELRRQFDDYSREPLVLSPGDARALQQCCDLLFKRARELETEVSRKRWNEAAHRERQVDAERVLREVLRPNSNVALFPIVPRPFTDGAPSGGAA